VDELNAVLGVLLTEIRHAGIRDLLSEVQHELFDVGADLATPPQEQGDAQLRIIEPMVQRLEKAIDHFEETLETLQAFILPGGSKGGALLHYARAVCRRAERSATQLKQGEPVNPVIIQYLNRLSDLLFVLARAENQAAGVPEVKWKK
jgi:cob(I)alamin adenosyltransferase